MKYLTIILLVVLYGCQSSTAQNPNSITQADQQFENLLENVAKNTQASVQVQADATKHEKQVVDQTVSKIVSLKAEIANLKKQLNEVEAKLDTVDIDNAKPYIILPISHR